MNWLSWPGLLLLVGANSAPVALAWLAGTRWPWPIDGGRRLRDGERLLGSHKTWRGLLAATATGAAVGGLGGFGATVGAMAGAGAMVGDALSSFVKRRLRRPPGAWLPGLDQLPEATLPLAVAWPALGLDWRSFVGTTAAFTALDLLASRLLGSSRRRRQDDAAEIPTDGAMR